MMLKQWMWILGILCPLLVSATELPIKPFSWRYGSGSNIDITTNTNTNTKTKTKTKTKTEFYRNGELVYADRLAGGGAGGLLADRIKGQRYYWAGGGGLPTDGVPVPDKAVLEMVSSHDRKRYRIKVNLPADLEQ